MKTTFKTIALLFIVVLGYQSSINAQENKYFTNGLPIQVPEGFIWGINGHEASTDAPSYSIHLPLQLSLLKEHQFDYYRLDIRTNKNGVPLEKSRLNHFLQMLKDTNIKILPIIRGKDFLNFDGPAKDYYRIGYNQTKGFLELYKDYFDYYALFNEIDHKIKKKRKFKNGIRSKEYDSKKFSRFANYLKGMTTAIRELDPTAKIIINSSGYLGVGFLHLLKDNQIDYDIIGYHWYSGMKEFSRPRKELNNISVYRYLANNFSQEVWITEINRLHGSGFRDTGLSKEEEEIEQRDIIVNYINEIDKENIIKAFFIYELLDQPKLDDGEGYDNPKEVYYGIMDWDERQNKYTYKKVSEALKFKIEETKNGYEDFIYGLFLDLTTQSPNTASQNFLNWKKLLKNSRNKHKLITEFLTTQANQKPIEQQYTSVLNKLSKKSDILKWKNTRNSTKNALIKMLLSDEYWSQVIIEGYKRRTGFAFYNN